MNLFNHFYRFFGKILLMLLVILIPVSGMAAGKKKKSKHPTFTHRYNDVALSTVLSDLSRKTDYEIVYNPDEIDLGKRITASFKDASARSVLKKVLDKDLECKSRKSTITIVRKPAPPIGFKITATSPSSVEEDSLRIITTYTDTIGTVKCHNQTVSTGQKPAKPEVSNKGHYVEAAIGGGYCGATLQAQYAYFFYENWGVYGGVGFSGTAAFQKASDKSFNQVLDSDGELYNHTVGEVHNWKDRYTTHTVDIPLGIEFQYPMNERVGLYGALGAKIGFPVLNRVKTISGVTTHNGNYAYSTHATIAGADFEDRDFYTLHAEETPYGQKGQKLSMPVVAAMVTADLGLSFPVSEQVSILTGVYAQVTCNDQRTVKDAQMGWTAPEGKYQHPWMQYPEQGIASTEQGKALIPYQVGVKIGVRWHHKPKAKPVPQYETILLCDTTYTLVQRTDTVLKPQSKSGKEIKEIMRRSVIWFDLDKTEPKLQPADILTKIAAILVAHPEQHILINGHASREGNERHNRRLSENRAKAVYDLLIKEGVPAGQMEVHAYSADVDYVEESGAARSNISLDRRVEIIPVVESKK